MANNRERWVRWLVVVDTTVIALGFFMVLLPEPNRQLFNAILFGMLDGPAAFGPEAVRYIKFVYAVLGAVLIGWGVALMLVTLRGFRRGDPEAWWTVTLSVVAWCVPDTTFSLASGFWQNAVLNAGFALAYAVPLVATRPGRFRSS